MKEAEVPTPKWWRGKEEWVQCQNDIEHMETKISGPGSVLQLAGRDLSHRAGTAARPVSTR